ncbi:MAG: hypothetical protein H0V82_05720 [Candidatus Protochlamydia sp.]|nr:hypothetical protein [Candidatus Protochlamydia sp.]
MTEVTNTNNNSPIYLQTAEINQAGQAKSSQGGEKSKILDSCAKFIMSHVPFRPGDNVKTLKSGHHAVNMAFCAAFGATFPVSIPLAAVALLLKRGIEYLMTKQEVTGKEASKLADSKLSKAPIEKNEKQDEKSSTESSSGEYGVFLAYTPDDNADAAQTEYTLMPNFDSKSSDSVEESEADAEYSFNEYNLEIKNELPQDKNVFRKDFEAGLTGLEVEDNKEKANKILEDTVKGKFAHNPEWELHDLENELSELNKDLEETDTKEGRTGEDIQILNKIIEVQQKISLWKSENKEKT